MTEDRRARKKRETRQSLRLAALRLVDAHGLEHVTVEMIAESADVSPRTFFNYFPTKEDALVGPGPEAAADVARFCLDRPDGEPAAAVLRALVLDRTAAFLGHSEELDLQKRVLATNPGLYAGFHAGFQEIERALRLEMGRRSGLDPERDLYPRLLAATGGAAIRSAMELSRAGDRRTLSLIVEEAFDLLEAGLAAAPPARRAAPSRRRRTAAIAKTA